MRIIAGEFGGRRLQAPKGAMTRPTTDRVREALMSAVGSAYGGFEGAIVLDAFAGSGALGLEALSRGADHAVFYEKQAAAMRSLKANVAAFGLGSDRATLCCTDIFKHPPERLDRPFDLVFLDPPYEIAPSKIAALLGSMAVGKAFSEGALFSYEHAKTSDSAVEAAFDSLQWESVSRKRYGDISLDIMKYGKP